MPESFQYGREVREFVTDEPNALLMRAEVGPTLLQRFWVTVDPDESDVPVGVQDAASVTGAPERCVDEDPSTLQCRTKELDDFCGEDGFVGHMSTCPEPALRG